MATPRTYQRVGATAGDYDWNVRFPARLVWDGVDDCLVVPVLDLSGTDKVTVIAGVTKLSDAAAGMVYELSTTVSNAGTFNLLAPGSAAPNLACASVGSGSAMALTATTYAAPISVCASERSYISAPLLSISVNGTLKDTTTSSQGSGNFTSNPLYIGQRAGISLPFNGSLQSLAVIGNLLPDSEVKLLEDLTNKAMGKVY